MDLLAWDGFILQFQYKSADSELKNECIFCARHGVGAQILDLKKRLFFGCKTWLRFGPTCARGETHCCSTLRPRWFHFLSQSAWLECARCGQAGVGPGVNCAARHGDLLLGVLPPVSIIGARARFSCGREAGVHSLIHLHLHCLCSVRAHSIGEKTSRLTG